MEGKGLLVFCLPRHPCTLTPFLFEWRERTWEVHIEEEGPHVGAVDVGQNARQKGAGDDDGWFFVCDVRVGRYVVAVVGVSVYSRMERLRFDHSPCTINCVVFKKRGSKRIK